MLCQLQGSWSFFSKGSPTTHLTFNPVAAMNICLKMLFCNVEVLSVGSWRNPPWALVRKRSNCAEKGNTSREKQPGGFKTRINSESKMEG